MNLLVISSFYPPHHLGGYEMRCKDVMTGLENKGHAVLVITNRCKDARCNLHAGESGVERCLHLREEDTPVITQIFWDIQDLRRIKRLIADFHPDTIYLWHIQNLSNTVLPFLSGLDFPIVYDEGGSGLDYLSRMHKRGIYFYRNDQDPVHKKFLKSFIYRMANVVSMNLIRPEWDWPQKMRVYFNSHSARQHAAEQGVPVSNASVIPSGIELDRFPFRLKESVHSPVKIILPARIKPLKGTLDGIKLINELRRKSISARLTLVGEVQSQAYLEEIYTAIDEHGVRESVSILPMVNQQELSQMYQEADFCFLPSYFKTGFSRTPLEAMASGCLVITYGNEGTKEIADDKETGMIVCEGAVAEIASIIEDFILNKYHYGKVIINARSKVESKFSMGNYINRIESFLLDEDKETHNGFTSG